MEPSAPSQMTSTMGAARSLVQSGVRADFGRCCGLNPHRWQAYGHVPTYVGTFVAFLRNCTTAWQE